MVVKLVIEYDGTDYCGWQVQPNGVTVQEKIQTALKKLTGQDITVTGSGRTDSGVHAEGQVASFRIENSAVPAEKFSYALNTLLPADIRVISSSCETDDFNARFSAKKKTYRYRMYVSDICKPLKERYAYRIDEVDAEKMKQAAALLVGKKDFKCFCAADTAVKDTVRTIYSLEVKRQGQDVTVTVCGNGFLYNMVRIIAGTLLSVGEGKFSVSDVETALNEKNRTKAGRTLPAKGLTLVSVEYK